MNLFEILRQSCGLTLTDAEEIFLLPKNVVLSYASDKTNPTPDLLTKLKLFSDRQEKSAKEAVEIILAQIKEYDKPETIELGIASNNDEANELGWGCVNAHIAVIRRIVELLPIEVALKVKIVPRGSTPATSEAKLKD